MIAGHSEHINQENYGDLFGSLQGALLDEFSLSLTKLYERPSKRNKILSIPSAIKCLEDNAQVLEIVERTRVVRRIEPSILDGRDPQGIPDPKLTNYLVVTLRASVPSLDQADACEISQALEAHKARRDKSVAHPDAIEEYQLPRTTWEASLEALSAAKEVLGVIGWSYLRTAYSDDEGRYFPESDATRAARALQRFLLQAGVTQRAI